MTYKFTHQICDTCWNKREKIEAVRLKDADFTKCCFCGTLNNSGIYIREDPEKVACKGVHPEEN